MRIHFVQYAGAAGLVLAFLFLGWRIFFFDGDLESENRPARGSAIIFFGDSLVEGVGSSPGNDIVSVLSRNAGVNIVNAGRAGDTTALGLMRLDQDVLSRDPRIVIVLLGGNDALGRIPEDETFRNLGIIIDAIKERGAAVLLLGVRGGVIGDNYKGDFKALARQKKVDFIPDILDGIFSKSGLMSDGIHPNDRGYAKMAERIRPALGAIIRR